MKMFYNNTAVSIRTVDRLCLSCAYKIAEKLHKSKYKKKYKS